MKQIFGILMAALVLAACTPEDDESLQYENYAGLGQSAPDFTLPDDETIYPRKGMVSLVKFWGLWCSDCLIDAPKMAQVRAALETREHTELLAIHVRGTGRYDSIEEYFEETGETFDVIMDPDSALAGLYGVEWYPSYLVVDGDGVVTHMQTSLSRDGGVDRLLTAIDAARADKHRPH